MCSDSEAWERFTLICKPEQSGKTFIMIQKINEEIDVSSQGTTVVNLIFCDNNLLLTKQTSSRLGKDVVLPGTQEKYIEFSSRKDGKAFGDVDTVIGKIMNGMQNVVCCTNSTRVRNTPEIVSKLNSSPFTKGKIVFKIWLDEADKFTNYISNTFLPLAEEHENVHCFCLTATPGPLFQQFGSMNVEPLMITTSPNYHGWEDNKRVLIENELCSTEGFVTQVMEMLREENESPAPGSKWFIPADHKKISHRAVRDILVGRGFAVFTVNGDGLELVLPISPGSPIMHPKTEELNQQILQLYNTHNLQQWPVAITGNICVGRGISIMSPEFMFDYGVLSSCGDPSTASQNAGRLKGNIKGWDGYKPPTVYTTPQFNEVVTEQEQLSRNLAGHAFEKEENIPSTITAEELGISRGSLPKKKEPYPVEIQCFDEDTAAIEWVKKTFKESTKANETAPKNMRKWRPNLKGGPKTLHSEEYYLQQFEKGIGMGLGARVWIKKEKLEDGRMIVFWNILEGEKHRRV
jgi:hypothetical protein